jgi:hypothetical protein
MFLRVLFFLLIAFFVTSCDKISFSKKDKNIVLNNSVDFSSVDTFPSFKVCDSIIDKTQKADCFRTTIHQKIGAELRKHAFIIKDSIDEVINVDLLINSEGVFTLDAIQSSNNIKKVLPHLDSLLRETVEKLPKIHAANKRGIPVTIKYSLPIRIKL